MKDRLIRAILVFAWERLKELGIIPIRIVVTTAGGSYMLVEEEDAE